MWGTGWNPGTVYYQVEKKVRRRWKIWRHTSIVSDDEDYKEMKVYNLMAGKTHWFRVVAREGPHSTPSDPIRFQTKSDGGKSCLLYNLIIHMTLN